MGDSIRVAVTVLTFCAWASVTAAQPTPAYDWSRGTTISGFGGFGGDGSSTGPILGASVGWDLSSRVAIEGAGAWLRFDADADTFTGSLTARLSLLPSSQRALPFLSAGIGMYRASFELGAPMPEFYARRIAPDTGKGAGLTFTDPSVVLGGGVNVAINRRLRIRPDVDVSVVFRDSHTYTVPSFRLHLVFVFEDHPVTPARRR